ncbi:hypothetical protein DPMN_057062 [Dreissena polymorpha]|uniref:Uncharacterized protein n=1 Tax=Dreissena polymorpha TaxID=45954 RepID=A0A9D4CTQ8_DREPO|nr:hypothetical protein DPMN_057062 [Dreissena polymorpha]
MSFSSDALGGNLPLAYPIAQRNMLRDVCKPSQLSSFDGRQYMFLSANKFCCHFSEVIVGLVL